jgi:uncharacterized phiE125 gp8 family phage protein
MGLKPITPPSVQPLTVEEVKAHLRVDHTDEDSLIALYIAAATSFIDGEYGFLGRALVTQTWELVLDNFPLHEIKIPLPPLQEVESIKYDDADGNEQVVSTLEYWVDDASEPAWVVPTTGGWPTGILDAINAVRVRFLAGYPETTDSPPDLRANIPVSIKQAMLLHIGSMYAQREDVVIGTIVTKLPFGAEQLLRPYRVVIPFA